MSNMIQRIGSALSDEPDRALDLAQTVNSLVLIDMSMALSVYGSVGMKAALPSPSVKTPT